MSRKLATLILLLVILSQSFCQHKHLELSSNSSTKYFFLFICILVASLTRHVILVNSIPVPYPVICITFGVLWGVGTLYSPWMEQFSSISDILLHHLDTTYIPMLIFSTAFCMDIHAFLHSLTQILIISLPVATFSCIMLGLIMRLVLDRSWSVTDSLYFGSLSQAIFPSEVIRLLRESGHRTKYVTILLEGETLLSACITVALTERYALIITGWIAHWYQGVTGLVRIFLLVIPMSWVYGCFGILLMKLTYNDTVGLMLVTISICYTSYHIVKFFTTAGLIGCTVCGIMMGKERSSLAKEKEESLISLWEMLRCTMNGVLFIIVGINAPIFLKQGITVKDYVLVLVTYLMANVTRFLAFFAFSPILSRTGYGMSFQNMVICVWGSLKNPLSLNLVVRYTEQIYAGDKRRQQLFFLHTIGLYILMLFINASFMRVLLRALGLSELSVSRQINMNNCLKFINEARNKTISILKMDRFLSDANWPLVTNSTTLKHPYKKKALLESEEDEEEEEYLLSYKFTFCPDCQKDVPNEPTAKEMREMIKEAKLRILKLKKTAYSRQFENGMISKHAIRNMYQAVEMAMDSQDSIIELDGLYKLFEKQVFFYRFLRNRLQQVLKNKVNKLKPPRLEWRLMCYKIVTHPAFTIFINLVVLFHMLFILPCFIPKLHRYEVVNLIIFNANIAIFFIYVTEFLLKIFAYSWILVCKHGFRTYFSSYWNILEFIILLCVFSFIVTYGIINIKVNNNDNKGVVSCYYIDLVLTVLLGLRLFRLLPHLKHFACCRAIPTAISKYLDTKVDRHRALAFELGKCYVTGEEEILENLHQIVDNDQIRETIREQIENDRLAITKRLGLAQRESPWVTTTVKTRLAMRSVLNSMKDDIHELKLSGWVDDIEYEKLIKSLSERYKYIDTLQLIQPPTSKAVFKEIPYMGDESELIEFLYTNVTTKKFNPGEMVINKGEIIEGIYIVISGMLMASYIPKKPILDNLQENGAIPIIDHMYSLTYDEFMTEYIVPGNSIGELSILTERGYDGEIIAETHTQVYVLNKTILKKAMEMDDDPVNGFECRIWKYVSFRRAVIVMMNVPAFRSYTQEKIKYVLERSFIPKLSNFKIFVINDMMKDIILVEGIVVDFNTRDVFSAPCYIPRACQRLILPWSSFLNSNETVETKLMIIPAKDFDEYDIMLSEEKTGELVSYSSSKCLQHLIQHKGLLSARVEKHKKTGGSSATTQARKKLNTLNSTTKSRINFMSSNETGNIY